MSGSLSLSETLASLPPVYASSGKLRGDIRQTLSKTTKSILVVLDDDPTGTQTCHDINVLTTWEVPVLVTEFSSTPSGSGFFILTNSRALHPDAARSLIEEICANLKEASQRTGQNFEVVLRSDSTLRGHFPLEAEAAEDVLGKSDVWLLAPFFLQGGRYTIDDVHYVAEGDKLVPVCQAGIWYRIQLIRDLIGRRDTVRQGCDLRLPIKQSSRMDHREDCSQSAATG